MIIVSHYFLNRKGRRMEINMVNKKKKQDALEQTVCKKNDIVTLEITDMGTEGEGIGRLEGYTLFVKDALIGDVVSACVMKMKKRYGYAHLLKIITPSPYRVEPHCAVARQCGGCQLQHCGYEKQLEWKEEKVRSCLNRIGNFSTQETDLLEPILSMRNPYYYRNKAQFPVGVNKEGKLVAGFYASRTHNIVENTDCVIQHPCNHEIIETVLDFMKEYKIPAYNEKEYTGLVRHILTRVGVNTGEVMVCLVISGEELPKSDVFVKRLLSCPLDGLDRNPKLYMKSICLNINREKTNVILGEKIKVLFGRSYIEDTIGKITYRISPLSFYQVNPLQTKKLYDMALEYADLQGNEVVWDLYCGIGTLSLFLAQKAEKVCGVEIVPQAVEDAKENAKINKMDNVEFFSGAAEEVVPAQYEKSGGRLAADVVVLDPPRKGCDEKLLQTVVQMKPEKIVYVSCDPATLARDLRYLCDRGYELKRGRACDMFGQGYHVETVVKLSLKKDTPKIEVTMEPNADISNYKAKERVTYQKIKDYVKEQTGLNIHTSYIAQVKEKCGLDKQYTFEKVDGRRVAKCPPEKEAAIMDAFRHFGWIQ